MVQNFVPASDYGALRVKDRTAGHSDRPLAFITQSFSPRQQKPTPEEGRPKTKKGAGWPRWERPVGTIGMNSMAGALQHLPYYRQNLPQSHSPGIPWSGFGLSGVAGDPASPPAAVR